MNKKLSASLALFILVSLFSLSFYPGTEEWTKTELYFGLSKPDGGSVTNDEFNAFTDSVIAPAYYEGFTITNTSGGWYDPEKQKTIFEDSRIVVHFSKMDGRISSEVDTIRAKYKRYFNQQSVLRVDQKAEVSF